MIFRLTATLLALLLLLPTSLLAAPTRPAAVETQSTRPRLNGASQRQYHPRRVIVTYKKRASKADKRRARAAVKGTEARVIKPQRAGTSAAPESEVLMLTGDVSVETAVARLRRHAAVATAEPDRVYRALFTPDDPNFSPKQWHLQNTGQSIMGTPGTPGADINAPQAWDRLPSGGTTPAIVAVIDSGIDLTHPDLTANIWTNPGETPANGIDDDNNGYVDDVQGHNWGSLAQWEFGSGVTTLGSSPTPNSEIAQSFIGNGGRLAGIWVNIWRFGTPTQNVTVSIRSSRSGADLDSFTLEPGTGVYKINDHTESYWYRWSFGSFSSPLPMTDGQTYFLVVSTTNNSDSSYYAIGDSAGVDGFADGNMSVKSGSWTDFASSDTAFELVVDSANGYGGRPRDDLGHGTHVGGIVAATTDNTIGVAGVAGHPAGAAAIMPLRALDSQGFGYDSDISAAIYYAADNGADVINMSLGGTRSSPQMQTAVNYAVAQGVTILAASGNNYDSTILYPAAYNNVIGVGATTNQDVRALFSNYNASVDVSAPGQYIYSTEPTYPNFFSEYYGDSLSYEWMSGTSMATPVAAGIAALLARARPGWTPAEIEQRLRDTAVDLGAPGRDDEFGSGRVDAFAALDLVPLTTLSATPTTGNGTNGWYTTTPTITLIPDVSATSFFAWDTTSSVTTYTAPFQAPPGVHDLYYWSADSSLAAEPANNRQFKVDTVRPSDPTSVSSPSHTIGQTSDDRTIDIDLAGATDTLSGLAGYATSWTKGATETPAGALNVAASGSGTDTAASPALADGQWWFNASTIDLAGNRTNTAHLGPFDIDGPPTSSLLASPIAPDGDNGWYRTTPTLTLSADVTATTLYSWDGTITPTTYTAPFPGVAGDHTLYYWSIDETNMVEWPTKTADIKVDTTDPSLSMKIDGGAAYTRDRQVALKLSATDTGAGGLAKMRFMDQGGSWSAWETYSASRTWTLTESPGEKQVFAQVKDAAGNTSTQVSDTIVYDPDDPTARMEAPFLSTKISKRATFKVKWTITDPAPSSGIEYARVYYRPSGSATWRLWKTVTGSGEADFSGQAGMTYYFRTLVVDNAHNYDWSKTYRTIVPFNEGIYTARAGFNGYAKSGNSQNYLKSVRFGYGAGHTLRYKLYKTDGIGLVVTKGPNMGRAEIYVDGKYVTTVDAHASQTKARQLIFYKGFTKKSTHYLKVVNLGTPGRARFEVDGVVVGR